MVNNSKKRYYIIFLGHAMLLALTMSMIDFNTVFPNLVDLLTDSKVVFGALYSIMLGVPFIFNLLFSHMMRKNPYKRNYLILGINLRAISFLGIAIFVYFFSITNSTLVIYSLFFWIFLFSISGGFAGIAYLDIVGKAFTKEERGTFYTYKQLVSSISALFGGFVIKIIFDKSGLEFPNNYTLILVIAFFGLFLAGFLFFFLKESPSPVQVEGEKLKDFFKDIPRILKEDKIFFKFIVIQNLTSISLMILPFYMIYAKETFDLNNSYIGQYLIFQITGTIVSNFFWGGINKKWGSKRIIYLCILLGAFTPMLALILSLFGPNVYSIIFFIIGFVISGRRIGFDPYLLEISPEEYRTIYIGINGTFSIFVAITPLLGGVFIELFGFSITFAVVSLIMLFTGFIFIKNN